MALICFTLNVRFHSVYKILTESSACGGLWRLLFASTHLHFKILGCDKTGIRSWSRCLWLQIYNWPVSFLLCILLEVPAYKALNLHMYLVISSIYIDSCCSWLLHFWYFQYQECYFNLVFIDTHFDINIYIYGNCGYVTGEFV